MRKDPLEAERDFRQQIEGAAKSRRQAERSRHWLRTLALPFFKRPGIILLFVVLVGLVSFLIFIFGVATKWTDAYACTLDEARRTPVVIAELGEPIEAGFFAWGHWEKGTVTQAWYRTTLAGPKGKGTLRVQLYSSPIGSSLRMYLDKDGRTQQVYSGPTTAADVDVCKNEKPISPSSRDFDRPGLIPSLFGLGLLPHVPIQIGRAFYS